MYNPVWIPPEVSIFVSYYFFGLKSILADKSMATCSFFWLPFAWKVLFHPFTLNLCLSLELRWVSWRQYIVGSYFLIQPATLLIGEFNPFTFRVIIDKWGLGTALLSLVFGCSLSPLFLFPCVSVCHFSLVVFYDIFDSSFFMSHVSALNLCFVVIIRFV